MSYMVINTNSLAQVAAARLGQSSAALEQSLQRLASGSKITAPASDSAGLADSMKFNAQMARIDAATSNISNALSFSQTQDGYLQKVDNALNRMGELSVLSQDVTKTDADRALYNKEFMALNYYIRNVATKDFNGISLFSANTLNVTTDSEANTVAMTGVDLGSTLAANVIHYHIESVGNALLAAASVKVVINQLAADRANVGSNIETLTLSSNQMGTLKNSLSAANSQITDVDVATESTNYAKENILVQTGTAMLAQANSLPQSVLKLLQ